jgi:hypothetical protein
MKALALVLLAACASDDAANTAPFASTFSCNLTGVHLACDLGFDDPDGDFTRIHWDLIGNDSQRLILDPVELPDVAGQTQGLVRVELDLPAPPITDLYVSLYMFDAEGLSTWIHAAPIQIP